MRKPTLGRRDFLNALSVAAAAPLLARCTSSSPGAPGGSGVTDAATDAASLGPPQRLTTNVTALGDGTFERAFSGKAAPQNLEFLDSSTGMRRRLYDAYPRDNCPFAIDTTRELGAGGFALEVVDRTLGGEVPTADDAMWALNMVPFGVAIDGVSLDPSGPWYDGGAPDPDNPFDRACSGWEYDPIYLTVSALVGVLPEIRGHVQPGKGARKGSAGLFHYHGYPRAMLDYLRAALTAEELRQPLVAGYSGDGFWILDAVVPAEATKSGKRLHLFSGYLLRDGTREAVPHTNAALVPSGTYDGTYIQDWRFDPAQKGALIDAALSKDGAYLGLSAEDVNAGRAEYVLLDERNGLVTDLFALPGAPPRAYVYVMTPDWPEVPRWFAFEPSESFRANIIPLAPPAGGPPGRQKLYDACAGDGSTVNLDIHQWNGRAPY
jgi:hypothetical protein